MMWHDSLFIKDYSGFSVDEVVGQVGGDQIGGYRNILMEDDDNLAQGDIGDKVRRGQILDAFCSRAK